jgi:integrase
MSRAGTKTTTSGLDWNIMLGLTHRLKQDGNHTFYLFILCGCYFGLRAGDLLALSWPDVLDRDDFTIREQKTGKSRKVTINPAVRDALRDVSDKLARSGRSDPNGYVFANRWGGPLTISYVNKQLHNIFSKYNVRVQNPSTHTLRKTFGKAVWERDGRSERALIYLSEIFSHSSIATTRKYIGVTERQIADVYLKL